MKLNKYFERCRCIVINEKTAYSKRYYWFNITYNGQFFNSKYSINFDDGYFRIIFDEYKFEEKT